MKAFIFDFDGVIVDSERHWRIVGDHEFFPSLIPGWTEKNGAEMMGFGMKTGYEFLRQKHGLQMDIETYEKELDIAVKDIYTNRCVLLPGLMELLDRLDDLGLPLAIASSSQRKWIEPSLERFKIRERFRAVCGANDVDERTKPKPDVYRLAAKRLKVDPWLCVALEDSEKGLESAKGALMKAIAIRTDMNPEQDLSKADMLIKHYDELTVKVLETFE